LHASAAIAETLAGFATGLRYEDIPPAVLDHARHLILDGAGIALAASTAAFARQTAASLRTLGSGDTPVIGLPDRLALRDAVLLNGALIHGLDYDDTHMAGVVHVTSSAFPCALGVAAAERRSGRDLLTAYILAVEVSARLGAVAKGELNQIGFHPTGVVAAFGSALAAGWLLGLNTQQQVMAQGIVLSMAAGTREYSSDGSWTKRLHPGWAAACGITAAALARGGFVGPRTTYEGRFGLFATHLGAHNASADLDAATRDLGRIWETGQVAVKPVPACQHCIACIDAGIALSSRIDPSRIVAIEAVITPHAVAIVCEPAALKLRPTSSYAAQFSLPFCIASALLRGRFGLAEADAFTNSDVLALAAKVTYRVDPATDYPLHFPGSLIVTLDDGSRIARHEPINRGAPDRPVEPAAIREKFFANASLAVPRARAEAICEVILSLDDQADANTVAEALKG
jgi:2-methylcitrate dehydratase PrpD